MPASRPPKKSETLEIRLPHATKLAFMDRCKNDGVTASQAVRGFIEEQTAAPVRVGRSNGWIQALAALTAGLAIGAAAAPSLAQSSAPDRQASVSAGAFDRLDADGDGVLTRREFERR